LYGWNLRCRLYRLRGCGLRFGFWLRSGLRFDRGLGAALDLEEDAAGGAHVEHGRGPLLPEASAEERFAGLGDGGVYREAVGEGSVELFGEGLGGVVADLELHGDDGG
jgi:hypothetical protein